MAELSEIRGTAGNDTLNGTAGNDTIYGNGGNDTIAGNGGDDTIYGGSGTDLFKFAAGDGKDIIRDLAAGETVQVSGYGAAQSITQSGSNVIVVFSGTDQITFYNSTVATVQAALQFSGGGGGNVINGTSGDDTLDGTSGNDTINGFAGHDTISGGAGADTIHGSDGVDVLFSGSVSPLLGSGLPPVLDVGTEIDTLSGGEGDDFLSAGWGDNVDGGNGVDTLYVSFKSSTAGVTFDARLNSQTIGGGTITGIENIAWVEGSEYDDYVNLGSESGGLSGLTRAYGMGGNDTLIGGIFTWLLDGGAGNDVLDGRNSTYIDEIAGGSGQDTIYGSVTISGGAGIELNGGDGDDVIHSGTGNEVTDRRHWHRHISIQGREWGRHRQ